MPNPDNVFVTQLRSCCLLVPLQGTKDLRTLTQGYVAVLLTLGFLLVAPLGLT
jgi:hypothetical protein